MSSNKHIISSLTCSISRGLPQIHFYITTPMTVTTGESKISPSRYRGNGTFETSTGTLYVSKPYRSRDSKKLRALITFEPRSSTFDMGNEDSNKNEFRVRVFLAVSNAHPDVSIGVLYSLLDVDVHIHNSDICQKYRNQWQSSQSAICNINLGRRHHPCP